MSCQDSLEIESVINCACVLNISYSQAAGRYSGDEVISLKISLPRLSNINHEGRHLFFKERPSRTTWAN